MLCQILELAGVPRKNLSLRRRRRELISAMEGTEWTEHAQLGANLLSLWRSWGSEGITDAEAKRRAEFELGRKLLVDIARISPNSFARLQKAIDDEREGEIEGLISAMNVAIDEHLNFKRWWTQDTNFDIQVKARERELALVIQDRTKSSYSFAERSQGLQYFLSYFVQLEAHKPFAGRDEVMLLDGAGRVFARAGATGSSSGAPRIFTTRGGGCRAASDLCDSFSVPHRPQCGAENSSS